MKSLKKKWGDIATLRVILVTFTKYLLCSKFLSFSLHCWVFVTNYRIRHDCMYCMDKKGSKIQTLFFKDIWACMYWNKSHFQVHPPAWESTCLLGIFARFSIFLSLPFSLDSFSVPWVLQYLKLRVNNLSCKLTLKDLWLFYVNDEKVTVWRQIAHGLHIFSIPTNFVCMAWDTET